MGGDPPRAEERHAAGDGGNGTAIRLYLLGGSILVETVFTWPGSGFLLSKAIINRDVPVLQGTILTLSMVFVATNLVVDLLQSLIDPRIRRG
jgi:peptide/nickel transport system permease protein